MVTEARILFINRDWYIGSEIFQFGPSNIQWQLSNDTKWKEKFCGFCWVFWHHGHTSVKVYTSFEGVLQSSSTCWQPASGPGEDGVVENFLECHVVWLHSDRPTWEMTWKNSLYIWFLHFALTEIHWYWHYPCHCTSIKKNSQWGPYLFCFSKCNPSMWRK